MKRTRRLYGHHVGSQGLGVRAFFQIVGPFGHTIVRHLKFMGTKKRDPNCRRVAPKQVGAVPKDHEYLYECRVSIL